MVAFSGFSPAHYSSSYLREGDWNSGYITINDEMRYPTSFIMTTNAILRKIYVLFCTEEVAVFEAGATVLPFVCLAVSDTDDLVYRILPNTIFYADPFVGGVSYPARTIRRGALPNLAENIAEGTLVAILAGIIGRDVTYAQSAMFSVNGGLYLE